MKRHGRLGPDASEVVGCRAAIEVAHPGSRISSAAGTLVQHARRVYSRVAWILAALVPAAAFGLAAEATQAQDNIVVALAGVRVAEGIEDPAPLAAKVESEVTAMLRESGFEVLPSGTFDAVWQRRLEEARGYYDIFSGEPDLPKRRALRAASLRELRDNQGARVLLQPALVGVTAPYSRGKATWDGAQESAAPTGSGDLPALSLSLAVESLDGEEIGASRAGLQLLAKYSLWNGKYGVVPRDKLLADNAELREAVRRAVTPLLGALRSAPGATEVPEAAASQAPTTETAVVEIAPPPAGSRVAALRALRPPGEGIVVPPDVEARCAASVRVQLEQAGWWILPPDAFERTLRTVALEHGGLYDPITGRGDAARFDAAIAETRRRLSQLYSASIFVTAGFFVRQAHFLEEKAAWDGVSEQVAHIADWKKAFVMTSGVTRALSFGVFVRDTEGTPLHTGWGGIHLIERLEKDRFVRVPDEELFRDAERIQQAVDMSLRGWLSPPDAADPARQP